MEYIETTYGKIFLNFEIQYGTVGRPFKEVGLRKNMQIPPKWIDKVECWHWIYTFNYQDENKGGFEIEIGYQNQYITTTKKQ